MIKPIPKAFSLLTAIGLIVLISAMGIVILAFSTKISKETYQQYHQEQAKLLAVAYTKLAIQAVTANTESIYIVIENGTPREATQTEIKDENITTIPSKRIKTGMCIDNLDGKNLLNLQYNVKVRLHYIGHTFANFVHENNTLNCKSVRIFTKEEDEYHISYTTPITIIIDTYVEYKDQTLFNTTKGVPWVTYHKRTVEQI